VRIFRYDKRGLRPYVVLNPPLRRLPASPKSSKKLAMWNYTVGRCQSRTRRSSRCVTWKRNLGNFKTFARRNHTKNRKRLGLTRALFRTPIKKGGGLCLLAAEVGLSLHRRDHIFCLSPNGSTRERVRTASIGRMLLLSTNLMVVLLAPVHRSICRAHFIPRQSLKFDHLHPTMTPLRCGR
jgi:hypothetical protein